MTIYKIIYKPKGSGMAYTKYVHITDYHSLIRCLQNNSITVDEVISIEKLEVIDP